MKTLTLIIKQVYFDQILSGAKKQEFRDIKESTEKKYITAYITEDGQRYTRNNDIPFEKVLSDIEVIQYDTIQFYVGYNNDRDSALVEVKKAEVEYLDGHGFFMFRRNDRMYYQAQMVYTLGKVLNKHLKSK